MHNEPHPYTGYGIDPEYLTCAVLPGVPQMGSKERIFQHVKTTHITPRCIQFDAWQALS